MTNKLITMLILALVLPATYAEENDNQTGSRTVAPIPELDCIIQPSEVIDLGAAVSGVIKAINADRRDRIEKGSVLVQLESAVEQASVNLASARAKSDTLIKLREANLALGTATQSRSKELLQSAAISAQDMDQVETELRVAELSLRQEQENKQIAGMELQRAMAILQQRKIQSPVAGIVMERFKSVGEFIDDDPVLRIAKLDPLHVDVIVPVEYLGAVSPGMEADVTPVAGDTKSWRATVERVDQVVDASSGTFGVRLSLPNPQYKLAAGLRCTTGFVPAKQGEQEKIAVNTHQETAP